MDQVKTAVRCFMCLAFFTPFLARQASVPGMDRYEGKALDHRVTDAKRKLHILHKDTGSGSLTCFVNGLPINFFL
jgi:hypothetical protein